jgi:hypothetical protein
MLKLLNCLQGFSKNSGGVSFYEAYKVLRVVSSFVFVWATNFVDRLYSYDTQAKIKLSRVTILKEGGFCKIKMDRKRFSNMSFA